MAMELESVGVSAGAGFITAVLTLLGFNSRLAKLEREKADKNIVDELRRTVESNRLISEGLLRGSVDDVRRMIEINKSDTINMVKRIEDDIRYIRERIDTVTDRVTASKERQG